MTHTCHADGCTRSVPARRLMCTIHWRVVPVDLQKAVWAAYVPGQEISKTPSLAYLEAAKAAIRAVAVATQPGSRAAVEDRVDQCVLLRPEDGTVAAPMFRILPPTNESEPKS